jgi:hypothetical protein
VIYPIHLGKKKQVNQAHKNCFLINNYFNSNLNQIHILIQYTTTKNDFIKSTFYKLQRQKPTNGWISMWATVESWAPKKLPRIEIVGDSDLWLICKRELPGKANEVVQINWRSCGTWAFLSLTDQNSIMYYRNSQAVFYTQK